MKSADTFAANLHAFRKKAGLTQKRLADVVGVQQPTVGHWERGNAQPSFHHIDAISKALGVEAWTLFAPEHISLTRSKPTPVEAMAVLAEALKIDLLSGMQRPQPVTKRGVEILDIFNSLSDEEKIMAMESISAETRAAIGLPPHPAPRTQASLRGKTG